MIISSCTTVSTEISVFAKSPSTTPIFVSNLKHDLDTISSSLPVTTSTRLPYSELGLMLPMTKSENKSALADFADKCHFHYAVSTTLGADTFVPISTFYLNRPYCRARAHNARALFCNWINVNSQKTVNRIFLIRLTVVHISTNDHRVFII